MLDTESSGRLRVAVLFGGRSGEHAVSLRSATSVIAALDDRKHEVLPVYLDEQGNWFPNVTPQAAPANFAAQSVDPTQLLGGHVDVVFPVLHGTNGEDGTMQGLLEILNVPYVGPGVVASATAMDKGIFKRLMQAEGLPVLAWELVTASQLATGVDAVSERIESRLRYPVFTKPANLGSSVGISRCTQRSTLVDGLREAARYDRRIIVEQGIQPRELEIAILGNDEPRASVVGEIRPQRTFYDYTAKYVSGDSELLIPAPLTAHLTTAAQELALAAYKAIDGAGMARVDLFLDE